MLKNLELALVNYLEVNPIFDALNKQRIADLQVGQKAARQMYDAACQRLGIPNDLEEEESGS